MQGRRLNMRLNDGVQVPAYAHNGDAGLDLRIVPCTVNPIEELEETERGAGGFGSTGVR
ncbi:hypothetical protein [Olsenella sp. Marseille-P4559]|uniref:hypothetical protein n=1 Tax=Olsenella sp. Marseille-P4559 TaxID=2364795 RepID=UPI0013EF1202|nr:hypothetical protein [Olsenella sp. Marseille-P4559]